MSKFIETKNEFNKLGEKNEVNIIFTNLKNLKPTNCKF